MKRFLQNRERGIPSDRICAYSVQCAQLPVRVSHPGLWFNCDVEGKISPRRSKAHMVPYIRHIPDLLPHPRVDSFIVLLPVISLHP